MAFITSLGFLPASEAKLVQIIHTNDLHSFFAGSRTGLGGYARAKTIIDQLKTEARDKGIPSLYLDGGDFGEGSTFYFSNKGVDALRGLDYLGVDVAVLGNHDFMLGSGDLKRQIKEAKLKAKIISANVAGKKILGLADVMPDYVDYNLSGLKLRVFGLTTSEIHYQYPFRPLSYIASSHNTGIKQAQKAVKDNVDYTIALTHIGLDKDIRLVEKSRTIDLVVGGHDHIKLYKPAYTTNLAGRSIPILQAGSNSLYVGSLLVDVKPKGESIVVDYRMYDINENVAEDRDVKKFVDEAYINREQYFNRRWDEIIGFSEFPLSGSVNGQQTEFRTCWSRHIARLTRQKAKADLGLQFDVFQGEEIPAGTITYGDMIDNFPHFRKWNDRGWKISKGLVSGFLLKKMIEAMASSEIALQVTIDGMESKINDKVKVPYDLTKHRPETALVNGQEISNLRYYTVGLPSEVPYGMLKLFNIFGYVILNNLYNVPNGEYWPALEEYIKKNSPLRCLGK